MALEMQDLMALKSLENGMSPYEQVKVGYMQNKHRTSGVGVAGLVLGCVGTVAGVGAGIVGWMRGKQAQDVAAARYEATQKQIDQMLTLYYGERSERIAGDVTLNQTITDTVSGSQQGSLTAQQQSELSAVTTVSNNLLEKAMLGGLSENPTKVQIYSAPQPCACPNSCGCGQ